MSVPTVLPKPIQLGNTRSKIISPLQPVKTVLKTTGVQADQSYFHNFLRVVIVLLVIAVIISNIIDDTEDTVSIEELSTCVRPGTILYQSINELDDEPRKKYLLLLKKKLIDDNKQSIMGKYIKNLKISLLAAVISEYVINGKESKPLSVISKTIFYSAMYTTMNL